MNRGTRTFIWGLILIAWGFYVLTTADKHFELNEDTHGWVDLIVGLWVIWDGLGRVGKTVD